MVVVDDMQSEPHKICLLNTMYSLFYLNSHNDNLWITWQEILHGLLIKSNNLKATLPDLITVTIAEGALRTHLKMCFLNTLYSLFMLMKKTKFCYVRVGLGILYFINTSVHTRSISYGQWKKISKGMFSAPFFLVHLVPGRE